ncbi:hypothetical protein [Vibrio barjaei]|uniref:hypothetical protein n=1 Tax=Vibrio barjaei TaxID=1676683 RepID=UPI00228433D6|nr:hypothetical protein [Vibrio barjaei]MCY9874046.1 hypothetical protein [Vibrio barjaei]
MRDDVAAIGYAKSLGFVALVNSYPRGCGREVFSQGSSIPPEPLVFECHDVRVWLIRGGWRYADYSGANVTDHSVPYPDIKDCLKAASEFVAKRGAV